MENNKTIEDRQEKEKSALLEILKEMPIIQVACKKAGVGRSTYYRWRSEDENFTLATDTAIKEGIDFINDMSESQIIQLIMEKKLPAIAVWLKHNSLRYGAKATSRTSPSALMTLTADEEKLFRKALALSSGTNKEHYAKRNHIKRTAEDIAEQELTPTPSI